MKREIKFRVWNEKTNSWIHGPGKEVNLFGETILLGGFMYGVGCLELNNCIALQFTGLIDATGKEIYEGDILRYKVGFKDTDRNPAPITNFRYCESVVVFLNGCFFAGEWCFNTPTICNGDVTVIGNMFENLNS